MEKISIPTDINAELIVLGTCLKSINACNEVTQQLKASDFFDPRNREIWARISDLVSNDSEVTLDSLMTLEAKVGVNYLVDMFAMGENYMPITDHIASIKDAAVKREVQQITLRGQQNASKSIKSPELIQGIESELFSLSQGSGKKIFQTIKEVLNDPIPFEQMIRERVEKAARGENVYEGFPTGFIDLDKLIQGLTPSHLTVVGARPSVGKTSFLLNIVEEVSLKSRVPVLFFSLEMPSSELCAKLICQSAEVNAREFSIGKISKQVVDLITQAEKSWSNRPVIVDDQPSLTIDQVKSRVIRAKRIHNIQIVFIDYLQLIRSSGKESRQLEIGEISRTLKEIAKELKVSVVCAAQLNRESEKRENKKPMTSD